MSASRTSLPRAAKSIALERIADITYDLMEPRALWDNEYRPYMHIRDRCALWRTLLADLMKEHNCSYNEAFCITISMRRDKLSKYYDPARYRKALCIKK
jgi:hypothetical protein